MKEIVYDVKTLLEPLGLVKLFGESSKKHVVDEFQSFVTSPTPILQIASFNKLTKWIPHDATTQFIKFCAKLLFKDETKYLYKSAITYMTSHLSEKNLLSSFESELTVFFQGVVFDDSLESNLAVIESIFVLNDFHPFLPILRKHFYEMLQILLPLLKTHLFDTKIVRYDHFASLIIKRIQTIIYKANEPFFHSISDEKHHTLYSTLFNHILKILESPQFSKETKKISGLLFAYILNLKKDLATFYLTAFLVKPTKSTSDIQIVAPFAKLLVQNDHFEFYRLFHKFDALGKISVLFAILNVSGMDVYAKEVDGKSLLMDVIVPEILSKLDVTSNQMEYFFNLQTLVSCLDKFLDLAKKDSSKHSKIAIINKSILVFIWNNWENPISNVFEILKKAFDLVMEIYDLFSDEVKYIIRLHDLTSSLLEVDWNRKGKYPTLFRVLPRIGSAFFIQKCPKLFFFMLHVMGNATCNSQAAALYEAVISHFATVEKDVVKWQQICLDPIVVTLTDSSVGEVMKSSIVLYLFPKVIKMDQAHLDYILTSISNKTNVNRTVIQILNICKPLGLLKSELDHHMRFVEEGMLDSEDLRINVLELLTSSVKLDFPKLQEFELIQLFLEQNANESTSTLRSRIHPFMIKFLNRLKTCITKGTKQITSHDKYEKTKLTNQINETKELEKNLTKDVISLNVDKCIVFVNWMIQFVQHALYPGCPHDKVMYCLGLYSHVIEVFGQDSTIHVFPKQFVKPLLNLFFDTYEKVRICSFEILKSFPSPLPGMDSVDTLIDYAMTLLNVGKLKEADAGACVLRLVYHKYILKGTKLNQLCIEKDNSSIQYSFFSFWLKYLSDRITLGESDIFSIVNKPIVGVLILLKNIITDSTFEGDIWKDYFRSLVTWLDKIKGACGKVICEFGDEDESFVDCRGHIYFKETMDAREVQSLIVSSWLSVKEAMFVFSSISEKYSLVETNQWELIGSFFTQIMLSTKHNGVIEKGAMAFQQLCRNLFKIGSEFPEKWLNQFLLCIVTEDKILRRSAGLPFGILAILVTEGPQHVLLNKTIESLFNVFENEKEKESSRIHALNILNSIFSESSLSSSIHQFVEKGFIQTLNGFSSPNWNIRNSSLMAYTSLIKRSIPTIMQNSTEKNVTFLEFFSRNPTLRSHLIEHTKTLLDHKNLHVSLFPILLLLSKLSPGIFDQNQNIHTSSLLDFVVNCTQHPNAMVRSIGARALLPLISIGKPFLYSDLIFVSSNQLHGKLLILYEFVKNNRISGQDVFALLDLGILSHKSLLIRVTFINIVSLCLNRFDPDVKFYQAVMDILLSNSSATKSDLASREYEEVSLALVLNLSHKLNSKETTEKIIWNRITLQTHHRFVILAFLLDNNFTSPKLKQYIVSLLSVETQVLILEKILLCCYTFDISPVDHYAYWEKLKFLYKTHRNVQIKQQVIQCIGHEVKNMLMDRDPIVSTEMYNFWISILEERHQEEYNRLACAKSVGLSTILKSDKKKLKVLFCCLDALCDDSEQVRLVISSQLNTLLGTNSVGIVLLQKTHQHLFDSYGSDALYHKLLMTKFSLRDDFSFSNLKFKLFEKDVENNYQEEVYEIQIAAWFAKDSLNKSEKRREYVLELAKQLDKCLDEMARLKIKVLNGLTSQREVFLCLYRILMGMFCLQGGQDDEVRRVISRLLMEDKQLNIVLMELVSLVLGESRMDEVFYLVKKL